MFGSTLPDEIIFRTFNDGKKVDEYEVNSDITKRLIVQHDFDDFDLMEIEFTKTKEPFNRIVVDYFSFGDITDFTMERQDMTSSPKSIKQELVKAVRVPCYSYQKGTAIVCFSVIFICIIFLCLFFLRFSFCFFLCF